MDPEEKSKKAESGKNIFDDGFFDALNDIDDGLSNMSFQKIGTENQESIQDVLSGKNKSILDDTKTKDIKLNAKALPVSKLPQTKVVKETEEMNKPKFDPLDLPTDDPASTQMREIWENMNTPDASEFKLMVLRLEPTTIKGMKISGYLETFHLPTTIPDIIEQIGQKYGGGRYQIRIVDGAGKYVKSKSFEISGLPKIPGPDQIKNEEASAQNHGQQPAAPTAPQPVASPAPASAIPPAPPTVTKPVDSSNDDDDDNDDDTWDSDDYEFDPTPRRRLRPMSGNRGYPQSQYPQYPQQQYQQEPAYTRPSVFRREEAKDNKEVKEVEEKVTKLESKIDKIVDLFQTVSHSPKETGKSLFDPDVLKALAPVVVTWLDSKGAKETTNVSQFSEMNKQIVGLMQGMQDLVRIGDKSKDDITEKERKEREASRREMLEYQAQMEQRFLAQQQRVEERHQLILTQMKDSLESKHREASESEQRTRLEYEKLRQDFREKEERAREEARIREEKLREESRIRDTEAARKELEFREKARQEEVRWREELRQREETARQELRQREDEARRREMEFKEELRQKEIAALNEVKMRELEMMKQMRDMDGTKTNMQQKLIEQIYSSNNSNRESQLQMELAVAKMTSDNEARMLQSNAEMQLEKIRHATQMQMSKMKHDLSAIENKRSEDPIDATMQDYLKRKLQIDMIKELNMDVDEGDLPNNNFMNTLKKLAEGAGPILWQVLSGGGLGGMQQPRAPMMPNTGGNVRPVNPTPSPVPAPREEDLDLNEEDFEEEATDDEVEEVTAEDQQPEPNVDQGPDLSEVNHAVEIPKVAAFFKYLKQAIEEGQVTQEEAAATAKHNLAPAIVDYLCNLSNSKAAVDQLAPLLHSMLGEEYITFFTQPSNLEWMDKMLGHIKKPTAANTPAVPEAATEKPKAAAQKLGEPSSSEEVKEEPKGKKKRQKANTSNG